jgi:hypothetical protein
MISYIIRPGSVYKKDFLKNKIAAVVTDFQHYICAFYKLQHYFDNIK